MLGVPSETFRANKVTLAVLVLLAAALVYHLLTRTPEGPVAEVWDYLIALIVLALFVPMFVVGFEARPLPVAVALGIAFAFVGPDSGTKIEAWVATGGFAILVVWFASSRVTLHQDGVHYQSVFGSKEMRWDEVERFYYSAARRAIYLFPMGTYYWYELLDGRGNKLAFGNRIERPASLGEKLSQLTYPFLLKKSADLFDRDMDVEFGEVRLNRLTGLHIKRAFRTKTLTWDQVVGYKIDRGQFHVWSAGKSSPISCPLSRVPNAVVLVGLLDLAFKVGPAAPST